MLFRSVIDAAGCDLLPGGIDPHTHMELMFMGTVSADDFEWGTKAAISGGTTMIVDFCIPAPGASMLAAYQDWRRKSEKAACDYSFHMAVTGWTAQVFDAMILATAADANCDFLLSEDMHSGFVWQGCRVMNPFSAEFATVRSQQFS